MDGRSDAHGGPHDPTTDPAVLAARKARIQTSRVRTALAVNREVIRLYHGIGLDLQHRQATEAWGSGVVERLARELAEAFPGATGFSPRPLPDNALPIWRDIIASFPADPVSWDQLPADMLHADIVAWAGCVGVPYADPRVPPVD